MSIPQLFFGFAGRISPRTFIFCFLGLLTLNFILTFLLLPIYDLTFTSYMDDTFPEKKSELDLLVAGLFFWPNLVIGYKRLHDLGFSGKAFGLFYLCTLLIRLDFATGTNLLVLASSSDTNLLLLIGFEIVLDVIGIAFLTVMIFKKGQPHENRWGPAPV